MKKKKFCWSLLLLLVITFVFTSCGNIAPIDTAYATSVEPYGFQNGLWHGLVAWFSFFGSLINPDIAIYATHNNGGWYNFGFVLGSGIISGTIFKST